MPESGSRCVTIPLPGLAGQYVSARVFRPAGDAAPGTPLQAAGAGGWSGAGVLIVHGWSSGKESYIDFGARVADATASVVLALDLRGHGASSGSLAALSRADHLRDLIAGYDYLAGQPDVSAGKVVAVGASYGGYLSIRLTAERAVAGLALRSPALYPDAGLGQPTQALIDADPDVFALPAARAPDAAPGQLALAARYAGPVLLVLSEQDTEVPATSTAAYRAAFGAAGRGEFELHVLAGAAHRLTTEQKTRFADLLTDWMRRGRLASDVDCDIAYHSRECCKR